jgi:hypothetical protein
MGSYNRSDGDDDDDDDDEVEEDGDDGDEGDGDVEDTEDATVEPTNMMPLGLTLNTSAPPLWLREKAETPPLADADCEKLT